MSEGKLIHIDAKGLSEPCTKFIEKVSNAIGTWYEPHHIKNLAQAEVEADKIKAIGKIEINEIERRALERLTREEGRKQENMESIATEAMEHLSENSSPEKVDEDWLAEFFEKCRLTSDKDMQSLWARLLAGEANHPGAFSKRSIFNLASLTRNDAELFSNLCRFVWTSGGCYPLIFDSSDELPNRYNLNFASLNHLDSIGLINFNYTSGFILKNQPKEITVSYFGKLINIILKKEKSDFHIGKVMFTQVGQEIFRISGTDGNEEIENYALENWLKKYNGIYTPHLNKNFRFQNF